MITYDEARCKTFKSVFQDIFNLNEHLGIDAAPDFFDAIVEPFHCLTFGGVQLDAKEG